jgi:type IV secretory pathway VirJ component
MTRRAALLCSLLILVSFTVGAAPRKPPQKPAGKAAAPAPSAAQATPAPPGSSIMQFAQFGPIPVFRPKSEPSQVVLLFSGDQGVGAPEAEAARALSTAGAIVFALDVPRYLADAAKTKTECVNPGLELHALGQNGQARANLAAYHPPVLVGVGSGATFAFATLAQAPAGTWAGAVSLGFCPVLTSAKPFCHATDLRWDPASTGPGYRLLPSRNLAAPWIVLDPPGIPAPGCPAATGQDIVRSMPSAARLPLQLPQALAEISRKQKEADAARKARLGEVADLPLLEVPATAPEVDAFAVDLTGSGGWEGLDVELGKALTAQGVPLVALTSPDYFWVNRDPAGMARDLTRILGHYFKAWHKSKVILIGYSQGADIIPFMVNRLAPELRSKVASIGLIGPDDNAEFDMGFAGFMPNRKKPPTLPVGLETERLKGQKVVCVYGRKEKHPLCPELDAKLGADLFAVAGGHLFKGQAAQMVARFLTVGGLPVRAVKAEEEEEAP